MDKVKNFAITVLIIVILVLLLWWCSRTPTPSTVIIEHDTIYDSIVDTVISKPEIIYEDHTYYETIIKYQDIDTAEILEDYYTQRYYADSHFVDTNYSLVILDTVYTNKLIGRSIQFKNLRPTVINNTTNIYETKHKLGLGGGFEIGVNKFVPMIKANYLYDNKHNFSLGYTMDKSVVVGYNYIIFTRNGKKTSN